MLTFRQTHGWKKKKEKEKTLEPKSSWPYVFCIFRSKPSFSVSPLIQCSRKSTFGAHNNHKKKLLSSLSFKLMKSKENNGTHVEDNNNYFCHSPAYYIRYRTDEFVLLWAFQVMHKSKENWLYITVECRTLNNNIQNIECIKAKYEYWNYVCRFHCPLPLPFPYRFIEKLKWT